MKTLLRYRIMNQRLLRKISCFFLVLSLFHLSNSEAQNEPQGISPSIYIDQLGYLPSAQKIALVSSPTGFPYHLIDLESNDTVLTSQLTLAEQKDVVSGATLWYADFSHVKKEGQYKIEVSGIGVSFPFQIKQRLYEDLAHHAIASFYYHRSGTPLLKEFAFHWARPSCHNSDGIIYSATAAKEEITNATGGWFNGSDYGKYVVSGVYSAGILMMLHEKYPQVYKDGSLGIPERSNGIPDLLDEVRWELDFLFKMQKPDGSVCHKVTALEIGQPVSPEKDNSKRYLFPPSTASTASACALFAKASRLYFPHDATFSEHCLQRAVRAWKYLETHPSDKGFKNPKNVQTKEFKDEDDSDERFWAALELYLKTGDQTYQESALMIKQKRIPLLSASGYWGNVMPIAVASILQATPEDIHEEIQNATYKDLVSLADMLTENIQSDGFRYSLKEGEFSWGSNGTLIQNALILCLADTYQPTEKYKDAALDQLHILLGRNPVSMCYVTGFGARSPQNPYHLPSMTDKIPTCIPGLLVSGPNQFMGDSELKRRFPSHAAPATIYIDSEQSFSSNETDLTWNAVLAYIASYFTYE